jgi:geranylgeranyl pyrophosphate synthase
MIAFNSSSGGQTTKSRTVPAHYWDQALHGPVNEFLQRQGKRIRADLVELAYSASQGRGQPPSQLQSFVELLHAGSLIVDDIQDGADYRRNRPTLHRVVGVPLAINTGNWMYFAAFEKLVDLPVGRGCQAAILKKSLATVRRCHEGQALDLATNARTVPQADVITIANTLSLLKTGGLVSLAAWLGAAVAGAPPRLRRTFGKFGMRLGLALQMQNDLTELRKSAAEGETSQDLANGRVTWPWAWAASLCSNVDFVRLQRITHSEQLSISLLEAVETVGTSVVHRKLQCAIADLRQELGNCEAGASSTRILERLEQYHV